MSRRKKRLYTWIAITVFISALSVVATYYYMSTYKIAAINKHYDGVINSYKKDNSIVAFVLDRDVSANEELSEADCERVLLPKKAQNKELLIEVDDNNFYKYKKNMSKGTILYRNMVYGKDDIKDDLRKFEISSLVLPLSLSKGDYVDVRINFPSGLDYVVLSKKRLEDLARIDDDSEKREICLFYLDSEEILRLSSAIVDAYLTEGAYLYTTIYISSETQKKAQITYPCNEGVSDLIEKDPNIVNKAIQNLGNKNREGLMEKINQGKTVLENQSENPVVLETEEQVISISGDDLVKDDDIE